jgi:mono/diheme cytochrome c family protein
MKAKTPDFTNMNRTLANILIDIVAALLFLGMIATGYLLRFPLPPGSNKSLSLWGYTRHQWGDIHFWISLGLLVVLVVHLMLHWNWIVTVIAKRCRLPKTAQPSLVRSGVLTAVVVILCITLFAWSAQYSVKEITRPMRGKRQLNEPSVTAQAYIDKENIEFWQDVYPIFETHCLFCHGPQRQLGGFRVDRREDLFESRGHEPLVLPGQSAVSPLIAIVSGAKKDMPMADKHTLSEQDITRLKAWINSGAKWPEKTETEK